MKLVLSVLLTGVVLLCCFGCGAPNMPPTAESNASASEHTISGGESEIPEDTESAQEATERDDVTTVESNESMVNGSENQEEAGGELTVEQNTFYVTIEDKRFAATFADTSGAEALKEMLADGPITIDMSDYGGFEKVGPLEQSLPTSNVQTTTQAGDIVLYQGDQIVIFYGSNSWSYTRLGKINDLTGWTDALGKGNLSVTFSLQKP